MKDQLTFGEADVASIQALLEVAPSVCVAHMLRARMAKSLTSLAIEQGRDGLRTGNRGVLDDGVRGMAFAASWLLRICRCQF